jgi:hypothetical protein
MFGSLVIAPVLLSVFIASSTFAEDWRTIMPDVIYGHKAGMALTYDVVKPAKPNGAAVLFMVSGGWVSTWARPDAVVRTEKPDSLNLFEKIVDRGYTLILVRHGSSPYFKVPDAVADVKLSIRHIVPMRLISESTRLASAFAVVARADICLWFWARWEMMAATKPMPKTVRFPVEFRRWWLIFLRPIFVST